MRSFILVIDDCELKDMGYSGSIYTWCNRRGSNNNISERLDRFLANIEWKNLFNSV